MSTRRHFVTLLGGAAAWPLAARAQQPERMRRIGVLVAATADDPEYGTRMAAFRQGLALSGWTDGRNVQIDTRWATTDAEQVRKQALELAALAPDRHPGCFRHDNRGALAPGDPHSANRVRGCH